MELFLIGAMSLIGLVLGTTGFILGLMAYIHVKAMKESTHKIEYVHPLSQEPISHESDKALSKELRKSGAMLEPFDEEVIL